MKVGGKYELKQRLAVGGMGEVWSARNDMTSADVALKILHPNIQHLNEVERRFRHEARLGATLSHRNIVRVYDLVEEDDGTLILVMELLRGETLQHLLSRRAVLSQDEAIAIALQVLSALAHAHELGIVHRDLKPANVFLSVDPDGHVLAKLVDFGIAKVAESGVHTMDGTVLGTPRYMSPEQIRSTGPIDGRSDLFSVGTLLYEMLTGSSPFDDKTPAASLAAVLERTVMPDQRIDPVLWFVLQRGLKKQVYERFQSAIDFAAALREIAGKADAELSSSLMRSKPPPVASRSQVVARVNLTGAHRGIERTTEVEEVKITFPPGAGDVGPGEFGNVELGSTPPEAGGVTPDYSSSTSDAIVLPGMKKPSRTLWIAAIGVFAFGCVTLVGALTYRAMHTSGREAEESTSAGAATNPAPTREIPAPPPVKTAKTASVAAPKPTTEAVERSVELEDDPFDNSNPSSGQSSTSGGTSTPKPQSTPHSSKPTKPTKPTKPVATSPGF